MKKIFGLFALSMLAFAVVASRINPVNADALPGRFSLVPMFSIKAATVGNTFTVDVRIDYVVNLNTWTMRMWWKPSVLQCMNALEGPFLSSGGGGTVFPPPSIDNSIGTLFVGSSISSSGAVSGGGVVVTVTFKVLAVATTGFWITYSELITPDFQYIPYEWKSIDIFVVWDIARNFGSTGSPGIPGDIDKDGDVDAFDLALVGQYYGYVGVASGSP